MGTLPIWGRLVLTGLVTIGLGAFMAPALPMADEQSRIGSTLPWAIGLLMGGGILIAAIGALVGIWG